jgi:hypothetical protein
VPSCFFGLLLLYFTKKATALSNGVRGGGWRGSVNSFTLSLLLCVSRDVNACVVDSTGKCSVSASYTYCSTVPNRISISTLQSSLCLAFQSCIIVRISLVRAACPLHSHVVLHIAAGCLLLILASPRIYVLIQQRQGATHRLMHLHPKRLT